MMRPLCLECTISTNIYQWNQLFDAFYMDIMMVVLLFYINSLCINNVNNFSNYHTYYNIKHNVEHNYITTDSRF
jgi:hypothetical protein